MNILAPIPNPFGHSIISDAWDPAGIDVPEINTRAFELCLDAFDRVSSSKGSESIVLHGPAGSGKTHLLGRLQHRLVTNAAKTAPDGALRCIFIAVKLQTSPQMLWQHLRRRVVDDLLRQTEGASQLQRLVAHFLAATDAEKRSTRAWVQAIRVLTQIEDPTVEPLLDEVAERARLGFELRKVLSHLIYRRNLAEARGWMRGDPLPEEAYKRLGLVPGIDIEPEDSARELILSLCRLAGDSLPMVLCFDQVEALQSHHNDTTAFFRLGRLLADVFEADDNILLITTLQTGVVELFRKSVRDADWHRLARKESTLDPLDQRTANTLLQRRLDAAPELVELRKQQPNEPLWPLAKSVLAPLFEARPKVTARSVLMHAEQQFEILRHGEDRLPPPVAKSPQELLDEEIEKRIEAAERSGPSETEENLRHGLPLLAASLQLPWKRQDSSERGVQLVFTSPNRRTLELAICNQRNMNSLAATLRRFVERPSSNRRVILRDPRLPISKTAKKTREHLSKLTASGVVMIEPDREVLAFIEAVRGLLSDARSGDLAHEGLPVAVDTVESWLRDALDPRVANLLSTLFPTADAEAELERRNDELDRVQDLATLLGERCVLSLDEASKELGHAAADLERIAREHPTRFGLLAGPPAVLFQWLPPASRTPVNGEVTS